MEPERELAEFVPRTGNGACGEDCLLIPIWLGLFLSLLGFVLLTVCGLVFTGNQALSQWGFRIGVGLLLVGFVLTIAAA